MSCKCRRPPLTGCWLLHECVLAKDEFLYNGDTGMRELSLCVCVFVNSYRVLKEGEFLDNGDTGGTTTD
jgi:hypothetical protein